ncbi:hypothetical protein KP509_1Z217900 [Ceratopteris richardii]|nr:hypothetical protein KP509_1Z217900 [Ceratopteris richardii]
MITVNRLRPRSTVTEDSFSALLSLVQCKSAAYCLQLSLSVSLHESLGVLIESAMPILLQRTLSLCSESEVATIISAPRAYKLSIRVRVLPHNELRRSYLSPNSIQTTSELSLGFLHA